MKIIEMRKEVHSSQSLALMQHKARAETYSSVKLSILFKHNEGYN